MFCFWAGVTLFLGVTVFRVYTWKWREREKRRGKGVLKSGREITKGGRRRGLLDVPISRWKERKRGEDFA